MTTPLRHREALHPEPAKRRIASVLLLAFLVSPGLGDSPKRLPKLPRPTSRSVFEARLTRLCTRLDREHNSEDREAISEAFRDIIRKECSSLRTRFTCRVKDVSWRDGVATVLVTTPDSKRRSSHNGRSVSVTQTGGIYLSTTREEARGIRKNARVVVDAMLKPSTENPLSKRQVIWRVRSPGTILLSLELTSHDYTVTIAKKTYRPAYAKPDVP